MFANEAREKLLATQVFKDYEEIISRKINDHITKKEPIVRISTFDFPSQLFPSMDGIKIISAILRDREYKFEVENSDMPNPTAIKVYII